MNTFVVVPFSAQKTETTQVSKVIPSVDWSQVIGLVEPIQTCMIKHLKHLQEEYISKVL